MAQKKQKTLANLTEEQIKTIRKTQATLVKIAEKQPVFFNITQFKKLGLVREFGKTINNTTNWILTQKAKDILKIQL